MTKGKQIAIWVDEEFIAELETARWAAQVSRSEYIRQAVREKMEQEA